MNPFPKQNKPTGSSIPTKPEPVPSRSDGTGLLERTMNPNDIRVEVIKVCARERAIQLIRQGKNIDVAVEQACREVRDDFDAIEMEIANKEAGAH